MPSTLYRQNSSFLNIYQNNRQICIYSFSILYFFCNDFILLARHASTFYYKLAINQTCFQCHYIVQKAFIFSKYSAKSAHFSFLPFFISMRELTHFFSQKQKAFQNMFSLQSPFNFALF
ncbi:hypothetical protein ABPG74_017519 [Tetrahymena malaccensis]